MMKKIITLLMCLVCCCSYAFLYEGGGSGWIAESNNIIISGGGSSYHLITFKDIDNSLIDIQLLASGELPVPPTVVPSEVEKKLSSHWTLAWDTPVVAATESKTYTATWVNDYGNVVDDFSNNLSGTGASLKLYDTGVMVLSKASGGDGNPGSIIYLPNDVVNTYFPGYNSGLPSNYASIEKMSLWEFRDNAKNLQDAAPYATSVVIEKGITKIPHCFCKGCKSITSLEINAAPDAVVEAGNEAFGGCTSLTDVLVNGNITFQYCHLSKVVSGFASGADFAFTSITDESAQNILNKIVHNASGTSVYLPVCFFEGCSTINEITLPSQISGLQVYDDKYSTDYYGRQFKNCTALSSLTIERSLFSIPQEYGSELDYFAGCTSLATVDSLDKIIGYSADQLRVLFAGTLVVIP